jgi:prepilin-type processing-associated H-X9-DG protein
VRVLPLREGIERFFITDINRPWTSSLGSSRLPIMFDRVGDTFGEFNHIPGGANVLFFDGHVEFVDYPARLPFPASRAWATGFGDLFVRVASF